jgi:DNA-directed RNA polymerase subunit L
MAETQPVQPVEVISEDERCATIVIYDEDHTLGNAMRYVLSRKFVLFSHSRAQQQH